MAGAEPVAYGPLGLKPFEFYRLTPGEFFALVEGYGWRQEREEEKMAWAVAHIVNYSGRLKRPVTPRQLLGRREGSRQDMRTGKEKRLEWEQLKRQFGV